MNSSTYANSNKLKKIHCLLDFFGKIHVWIANRKKHIVNNAHLKFTSANI